MFEKQDALVTIETLLPRINIETGFYQGRIIRDSESDEDFYSDCISAAISNYLKLLGATSERIRQAQMAVVQHPRYNPDNGDVQVAWNPLVNQEALGNGATVTLYLVHDGMGGLPPDQADKFKFIPPGKTLVEFPLIGITKKGEDITHTFVMNWNGYDVYIIDNDGTKQPSNRYTLNGYFKIDGLKQAQQPRKSEKVLDWVRGRISPTSKSI